MSKVEYNIKKITPYEKEVLEILWEKDQSLTAREIVNYCVNKKWKPSYINIMIKSLLEKELIREFGFKRSGKNFARMYEPTMTEAEWIIYQINDQVKDRGKLLREVLRKILENTCDIEKLEEIQSLIEDRKRKLLMNK